MKQITAAALTAVALLMLAAGPASAAKVFYVGSNGADTASCGAITRPCRTIVYVLGVALDGDRIVVGPGVYSGFRLDMAVSLESSHGAGATVIQGGEPVIDVSAGADGAVIGKPSQGFMITGGTVGILVNAADVRVEDNVFVGVYTGVHGKCCRAPAHRGGEPHQRECRSRGAGSRRLHRAERHPRRRPWVGDPVPRRGHRG